MNHFLLSPRGRISRLSFLAGRFIFSLIYTTILIGGLYFISQDISLVFRSIFLGDQTLLASNRAAYIFFCILGLVQGIFSILYLDRRRLHDCNHSGWFALFFFIPFLQLFYAIYLMVAKGYEEENRYGLPRHTPEWEKFLGWCGLVFHIVMTTWNIYILIKHFL